MSNVFAHQLLELRAAVGALGELTGWWQSEFASAAARHSLGRLFPRTADRAALESTARAAQLRHDAVLNVSSYHLFRLPEALESELADLLASGAQLPRLADDVESAAIAVLERLGAKSNVEASVGPVCLGSARRLGTKAGIRELAGAYLVAARGKHAIFPYFDAEDAP
jgi:hypothetical protein